jgi:acylphosphatase
MICGYQLTEVRDMQVLRIIVTGRVQGVGFRYFIYKLATKMGVKGTVRNLDDGSVEIICHTDDYEMFIDAVRKGNGFSRVDDLYVEKIHPASIASRHLRSFTII